MVPSTVTDKTNSQGNLWASDGSMIPADANILDRKQVTAASTGPCTMVMKIQGVAASIMHGEIMGMITAPLTNRDQELIEKRAAASPERNILYTDHRNSVNIIEENKSNSTLSWKKLRHMNARSYYRWLIQILNEHDFSIRYTKAHTHLNNTEAELNREADHYATSAQRHYTSIPTAPIPTFYMDDYTFRTRSFGWIETNIKTYIEKRSEQRNSHSLMASHCTTLSDALHDNHPPPEFLYTRAVSAYSALVQLYAR